MTYWVDRHPGGAYNIQKWSQNNGTYLIYPSLHERRPHGMANWNNNNHKFTYVGRFGDTLRLGDLPNDLRKDEVLNYFDNSVQGGDTQVLVCGSPGEVENDKTQGFLFDSSSSFRTNHRYSGASRRFVWTMAVLGATDQLRQRCAWALSQVSIKIQAKHDCLFINFSLKIILPTFLFSTKDLGSCDRCNWARI